MTRRGEGEGEWEGEGKGEREESANRENGRERLPSLPKPPTFFLPSNPRRLSMPATQAIKKVEIF